MSTLRPWRTIASGLRAAGVVVLGVLLGVGGSVPAAAADDVQIVAHPDAPIDTVAIDDLRLMYLGKKARWSDDTPVALTVIKSGPVHESFVTDLLDRTTSKFNSYWKQIVFTGRGRPPKAFGDESALIAHVRATPGAIGYVSASASLDGVRKLVLR